MEWKEPRGEERQGKEMDRRESICRPAWLGMNRTYREQNEEKP